MNQADAWISAGFCSALTIVHMKSRIRWLRRISRHVFIFSISIHAYNPAGALRSVHSGRCCGQGPVCERSCHACVLKARERAGMA